MNKIYKIISYILIISLVIANMGNTVYAKEKISESNVIKSNNCSVIINGKRFTQAQFDKALNSAQIISVTNKCVIKYRGVAIAAGTYFIPGVGQVLITVTGVLIIGGAVICVGSWLYNKVVTYFAEHTKGKRPSTHDKHTKPRPGRDSEKKKQEKNWKKRK